MFRLLLIILVVALCAIWYVGRHAGWFGSVSFSPAVSLLVSIMLGLSIVWILILTIRGKFAERRVVFLYVGIAVAMPLFMSLTQKVAISSEAQMLYDYLQKVPPGSKVLVTFDYDPPSAAELQPMAESFLRYGFAHDFKMIIFGLWPQGPQQANLALTKILDEPDIRAKLPVYGVDYVNLGFQSGNEFVIQRLGSDFKSMFPADYQGTPYDSLPLVRNVRNYANVDYSFNLSAGYPGTKEWVLFAVDRYGLKMGAGNTAVQTTGMYPYVRSGQLLGILGGMNGAAEFEQLTGTLAKGTKFMLSQSFSHLVVVAFIVIGNVAYFMHERRKGKRSL
ncbi:MAG: hypothetical protein AB1644_03045 [Candidatus Zixiibacteriota bacterium]